MEDNATKSPHFAPYWGCPGDPLGGPFLRCDYVERKNLGNKIMTLSTYCSTHYFVIIIQTIENWKSNLNAINKESKAH